MLKNLKRRHKCLENVNKITTLFNDVRERADLERNTHFHFSKNTYPRFVFPRGLSRQVSFSPTMERSELTTVHSKRKYHLHIDLDMDYQPFAKRNTNSRVTEHEEKHLRDSAKKHIDIWSDGKIYPVDPTTLSTPSFSSVTSLLKFAGDGSNGLLGYCHHLVAGQQQTTAHNQALVDHNHYLLKQQQAAMEKVVSLTSSVEDLQKQLKRSRMKNTPLGWRQREKSISNIETLKLGSGGLKKRIRAVR